MNGFIAVVMFFATLVWAYRLYENWMQGHTHAYLLAVMFGAYLFVDAVNDWLRA